ncbi:MAG: hypothetical protein AVDCRST_MAG51-3280, partial [uncultured Ramlibacter sp.]
GCREYRSARSAPTRHNQRRQAGRPAGAPVCV